MVCEPKCLEKTSSGKRPSADGGGGGDGGLGKVSFVLGGVKHEA